MPLLYKPDNFAPVTKALPDGLIDIGGKLCVDLLLKAYTKGIFPWFIQDSLVYWFYPPMRGVLMPDSIIIHKSMRSYLNRANWSFKWDTQFDTVIKQCKAMHDEKTESWITEEFISGYNELHNLGYAHSLEVYEDDRLIGGLYGIGIGKCFSGESMFHRVPNASKYAFICLAQEMQRLNFHFIDCQILNSYTKSLGAIEIPNFEFAKLHKLALEEQSMIGKWTDL